jgi:selenium-binding protein 1
VATSEYGSTLHVWNWRERTLRQSIQLGEDGLIPLETRFFHDPQSTIGYVVSRDA